MHADGAIAEPRNARRPLALLALGAATGIVLAAAGLVGSGRGGASLPAGAAARVNGTLVRTEDYERAVTGVANDRRDGLDAGQRRHVLDRLIDEELLVQRGLELGLPRNDRKVRADLTAALIASVVAESDDIQPTGAQLQEFYDQHGDFFTSPGRMRLRQIFCRGAAAGDAAAVLARAHEASQRLRAGEAYGAVRDALGDAEIAPLPDALLPPAKLIDYIGPTALKAVLPLSVGEVSDPIRSSTGLHVLQVIERQTDKTPALADVKPQVLAEFRRRAGEQALRTYVDDLRSRADIVVDSTLK